MRTERKRKLYSRVAHPSGCEQNTGKLEDSLVRGTLDRGTHVRGTRRGFAQAISFRLVLIIAIAGFLIGSPAAWAAQSITIDDINIGTVGEDEFFAGYAFIPSRAIFWESDTPWRITVRSLDPDLGMSDNGTYIKPLGDLHWKLSDEEIWLPITQENKEIEWGTKTGEGLMGVVYVDFAVLLDWLKDVPGQYGTELVFTIESL